MNPEKRSHEPMPVAIVPGAVPAEQAPFSESQWVGRHFSVQLTPEKKSSGEITGFASSSAGRKRIFIPFTPGMEEVNPDMVYEIEVVDDTNPEDETKGKLTGKLLGTRALTKDEWNIVETGVNAAEALHRDVQMLTRDIRALESHLKEKTKEGETERKTAGQGINSIFERRIEIARERVDESVKGIDEIFTEGPGPQFAQPLVDLRTKNTQEALSGLRALLKDQSKLEELVRELSINIRALEKSGSQTSLREDFEEKRAELEQTELAMETLVNSNPEAYVVAHLLDLRRYKREMIDRDRKIVETPSVKEKIDEILRYTDEGQPVFLHGMPGSGKTETAIHLSRVYLGKEPVIISGGPETHASDFLGGRALTMKEVSENERKDFISGVTSKFEEWKGKEESRLQGLGEQARQAEDDRMWGLLMKSFEATHKSGTITKFLEGIVYEAMREGKPVIIDEANTVPSEVILALNHLLTRRPGDKIMVNEIEDEGERTFEIQPGFCFILTGNIGERFIGRKEIDSSTLSRLKMIEYDYLPQRVNGDLESERGDDNELFHMLIVDLMSRNGDLKIPRGAEKDLWRLAQATRTIQNVYSGKSDFTYTTQGNEPLGALDKRLIERTSVSFRNLDRIISAWKTDNFKFPVEHYALSHFINEIYIPKEKALIFQIFHAKGFFHEKTYHPIYGREEGGVPSSFEVIVDETELYKNKKSIDEQFTPRETVELAYGPAPLRTEYPGGIKKEDGVVSLGSVTPENKEGKNGKMRLGDKVAIQREGSEYNGDEGYLVEKIKEPGKDWVFTVKHQGFFHNFEEKELTKVPEKGEGRSAEGYLLALENYLGSVAADPNDWKWTQYGDYIEMGLSDLKAWGDYEEFVDLNVGADQDGPANITNWPLLAAEKGVSLLRERLAGARVTAILQGDNWYLKIEK